MSFNDLIRASVVCYAADGILQDSLIKLDAGISTDLPVGAVVDEDGESAASTGSIAYVLVEPAKAGDKYLIVANPVMVVLNAGNDSNLLIVFYIQIMPDDFVMQLHRF